MAVYIAFLGDASKRRRRPKTRQSWRTGKRRTRGCLQTKQVGEFRLRINRNKARGRFRVFARTQAASGRLQGLIDVGKSRQDG